MSTDRFISPEIVASHFHLRTGDKVGDFGAGAGNFSAVLSRLVGHEGRVYASEIQKNLVDTLNDRVKRENLTNMEVVWGDVEELGGTKIEDEVLDAAVIVNTLFQMEERETALREISRTLRSGGKLFIIDWSESWGGLGPQPNDVLTESEAKDLAESLGLTFERSFDAGDHHYGLAFRKA
ncbi:MAG: methyltransferase domain-containing protein [Candidatus Paceibacterota bacterium]